MINKYIDYSIIFALYENNILTSLCAVITIDNETIEIKILHICIMIQLLTMG